MARHILKCLNCSNYTTKKDCEKCSGKTVSPKPPKFSLQDKYQQYRREAKKEELIKKELL